MIKADATSKRADAATLEQQTGFLLQLAHQGARRVFNEALKRLEIQAKHLGVLMALCSGEPLTQIQLANRLELDKSSVVLIVDDLERLELAHRRVHPNDRRAHVLEITSKGRGVVSKAKQIAIAVDRHIFAGLSRSDRVRLDQALSAIVQNCHARRGETMK
jgi:MarR family transcriptional regulator, lower aerobic nicotinate degradation pathway regulator